MYRISLNDTPFTLALAEKYIFEAHEHYHSNFPPADPRIYTR